MSQRRAGRFAAAMVIGLLAGCGGGGDTGLPGADTGGDETLEASVAGITVAPTSGLTTSEKGATATFTVVLTAAPTADVTIGISSDNEKEGTVAPKSLVFTSTNWNAPQTVTVTGVDDADADGAQTYKIVTAPATSADAAYNGKDADDVEVKNTDDETAGITVTPTSGLKTSEAKSTASFSIVLNRQPTADVEIPISTSNDKEGVPNVTVVKFTALDWASPQKVTVTGVDDTAKDGDQAYEIVTAPAKSADAAYNGLDADDVKLINVDNESAGVTITPTSGLTTTEAGGTATFAIVLNAKPTADVTIPLSSSNEAEGRVSPKQVVFTPLNWDAPQIVTVTGQDDTAADGNQPYKIVTGAAVSSDVQYSGFDPDDVSLTNTDNETAGITVKPVAGLSTTEAGGQATFTIVLNSAPSADVTIPLSSSDVAEGTVSPASVTFTKDNWNAPQTVTVTGVDDAIADGARAYKTVTAPAKSADKSYEGANAADVELTNIDNDTAGIFVRPNMGLITDERGLAAAEITIVLNTKPTANVTIPLTVSKLTEGKADVASVTFTPLNWNAPQTVTVKGVDDDSADGNQMYWLETGAAVSTDTRYAGLDADDASITNIDDDSAGIRVMSADLTTTEAGGSASFRVVLNSKPTANVTIPVRSSRPTEGTTSPASLVFTPDNWNAPQTVTVTGKDDFVADGAQPYRVILDPATSTDASYAGMDATDVNVTNTDDDSAGITVTAISRATTEGGQTATFTVVLNSQPLADVTIPISSSDTTEGTVDVASLKFTAANWKAPQTVTVTGVNDDVADGNQVYSIVTGAATSTDTTYHGMDASDVAATNTDDDSAGIRVTYAGTGITTTEAGGTATFSIRLESEPTADVTIPLTVSDATEGKISVASLKFTKLDWKAPQTVTVTGLNDDVQDGNQPFFVITEAAVSADPGYSGRSALDVPVSNTDDDSAGITVTPISSTTTEAGGTAKFSVVLNSEPTADVTIALATNDGTEGVADVASLKFTALDWKAPQIVTVTGKDDFVQDGNQPYKIVLSKATSTDALYAAIDPDDVSLTNTDDDSAGVVVSKISRPTTEAGGTAEFTIHLTSEPTADVTITLSSDDTTEGTITETSVTFTKDNWKAPHAITVTGKNDDVADGDQTYKIVTSNAASADPNYNGKPVDDVDVSNTDNDKAGITVSAISRATTELGGDATFTIVLTSQPTADVKIDLSSSDLTEGEVSPAFVTFTAANWNAPQTVTVTGKDDAVADGNQPYKILTAAAVSSDPGYSGRDADDVDVTNTDDDKAGIVVSPISGPTAEGAGTATFTIGLTSQPTADVTIALSSSDETEGTVSPTTITFTAGDYAAKVITVSGSDDAVVDGNKPYKIITAPAVSADPGYSGRNADDVDVINNDNDVAGFVVSAADGPTHEDGSTARFTVKLKSQPTADVKIPVASGDTTEGKLAITELTFTKDNWNDAQTVVVTGVDDKIADGNQPYTVELGVSTSSDPNYHNQNPTDVSLSNTDNDTASIVVTPTTGLTTTEGGGTATFTIELTSEPTADVRVDVTSLDLTEGTVSPAFVTFTAGSYGPKTVTVTGVSDADVDGDVLYTVRTEPAVSSDGTYSGKNPSDVTVTNRDATPVGGVVRVSVDSSGLQGNSSSYYPAVSGDGRYVVFYSHASNLVAGDTNGYSDVFVHDRLTKTTRRVSVASDGTQANGESLNPSLSGDGRYVTFVSYATNLVAGDTNGQADVFRHDLTTGATIRVSVAHDGAQANQQSWAWWNAVSADGNLITFRSYASNLVAGDTNGQLDVFVRDVSAGTTERVSVSSAGAQGNNSSDLPALSRNGRYVVFRSYATTLAAGETNGYSKVYVRDRQTSETFCISKPSGGGEANYYSDWGVASDTGVFAFQSGATNLLASDANGTTVDIYVWAAGVLTRANVSSTGVQGNSHSELPSISADGRFVAFDSAATNLVTGDTNEAYDIFVHDRTAGTTVRIVGPGGVQGNSSSFGATLTGDGGAVAFGSHASTFVSSDTNGAPDVFYTPRP